MTNNKLFTIYGAKLSKSGERINITLIRGEDEEKEFATFSIKLGETKSKTKAQVKDDFVFIKIPMLKEYKKEQEDEIPFDTKTL